ncbi:hypothetical protein [Kribbella swartbergensis]
MDDAVLGIDIGGTRIKWVRWSPTSGVLDEGERATPRSGAPAVLAVVADLIGNGSVAAAGVAVPGHLSDDLSAVRLLPNLPGDWSGLHLADELRPGPEGACDSSTTRAPSLSRSSGSGRPRGTTTSCS